MACTNNTTNQINAFDVNKKPNFTASASIKKLLKNVRKMFKITNKNIITSTPMDVEIEAEEELHYCMTEEEYQNWQNELLEANAVAEN